MYSRATKGENIFFKISRNLEFHIYDLSNKKL